MNKRTYFALLHSIDVRRYFDDIGIMYSEHGKNLSDGWIGMSCCFCGDTSNHLGVNIDSKGYHCWVCGRKGKSIFPIVKEETGKSWDEFISDLYDYTGIESYREERSITTVTRSEVLPEQFVYIDRDDIPVAVRKYFSKRKLDISIISKYKLGWCQTGRYALKLVVPITMRGEVVSFQAIDVTGKSSVPKDTCPDSVARVPKKELVYGIDTLPRDGQMIIVEGIVDKWRIGDSAVAMLGKKFSSEQVVTLQNTVVEKNISKVKVVFDRDTNFTRDGTKLSYEICEHKVFLDVPVFDIEIESTDGFEDPGEMSKQHISELLSY